MLNNVIFYVITWAIPHHITINKVPNFQVFKFFLSPMQYETDTICSICHYVY